MGTPTSVATVIFRSQRMQFDLMPVVPRDWNNILAKCLYHFMAVQTQPRKYRASGLFSGCCQCCAGSAAQRCAWFR